LGGTQHTTTHKTDSHFSLFNFTSNLSLSMTTVIPSGAYVHQPLQGETRAQMKHASESKKLNLDTSIDSPYTQNNKLSGADFYVSVTFKIWVFIKVLFLFVPMFLFQFPTVALAGIYMRCQPYGTKSLNRCSCGFIVTYAFCIFFAIPIGVFVSMSYLMDCAFYYVFSILYCFFHCNWKQWMESKNAIAPYRNGPSLVCCITDIFVAIVGQSHRQGVVEMTYLLVNMWLVMPTLKYYVNCNPFIYKLNERFVQQITTSMDDMPVATVSETGRKIISQAKQDTAEETKRIDSWNFIPHYPYPPAHKFWAIGMQVATLFSLLVHVTHADVVKDRTNGEQSMFVFSNCVERPIYRVMLWYNNPFHFLTGFVEASVSNGGASQQDKKNGGEHPMWLVCSESPALNDRNPSIGWSGSGLIDRFFDSWLPTFVDEVRLRNRGEAVAKEMHEEVISKDGISRPAGKKPVVASA
jgi:hypothetical protein